MRLMLLIGLLNNIYKRFSENDMVAVAQLVRAPDCGSGGRGFNSHQPPQKLASVAQLDRALDFGSRCWGFKSSRGHTYRSIK